MKVLYLSYTSSFIQFMLNSTENTKAFLNEMRQLARKPKSKIDRKRYMNRNVPSTVDKLYTGNTDDFVPIVENREHLLNTMVPMIYSIARKIAGRFNSRIEVDDCINAGMIGAALATDRYIAKAKIEKQPAKLSSYAYAYIEKYINEHCRSTNSLVSHGPTEWIDAGKTFVNSGNDLVGDNDGKKTELFDIAPTELLKDRLDVEYSERIEKAKIYATKLFNGLSKTERQIIMMKFGISTKAKSTREIAKQLNWRITTVEQKLNDVIARMRNVFTEAEISDVVETLSSVNMMKLI